MYYRRERCSMCAFPAIKALSRREQRSSTSRTELAWVLYSSILQRTNWKSSIPGSSSFHRFPLLKRGEILTGSLCIAYGFFLLKAHPQLYRTRPYASATVVNPFVFNASSVFMFNCV